MLHLEDVNMSNWRTPLRVSDAQKGYVASPYTLLARAYAYRDWRSRAFLLCDAETPVGMGLYYDWPELAAYDFSELFIDERYQGQGYGKAAVQLVLDELRRDGKYSKVFLCYIEGNTAAKRLYEKLGFVECDRDEDEIILEREL